MRSFFTSPLNRQNNSIYALLALLLFILIVRLISLNFYPLMNTTEARYAENVAKNIRAK
ncbi:hypothetical protein [Helicobacter sp. T3_23-1056]